MTSATAAAVELPPEVLQAEYLHRHDQHQRRHESSLPPPMPPPSLPCVDIITRKENSSSSNSNSNSNTSDDDYSHNVYEKKHSSLHRGRYRRIRSRSRSLGLPRRNKDDTDTSSRRHRRRHQQQRWRSSTMQHPSSTTNHTVLFICYCYCCLCVQLLLLAVVNSSVVVEAFEVPTTTFIRARHVFSPISSTSSSSLPSTTPTATRIVGRRRTTSGLSLTPAASWSRSRRSSLNLWPKHLFFDSIGGGGAAAAKNKKGSSGFDNTRKSTSTTNEEFNSNDNIQQDNNNAAAVVDPPLSSLVDVSSQFRLARTDEDVIEKLDVGQRLICIGDVHGDIEALMKALEVAKVYDRQSNSWIGGNTIVVQTGDILDRGTEELACYSLLAKLSQEAPPVGGRVVLLAGNHEIMNAIGNFDYVTDDQEFESSIGRQIDESFLQSTTLPSTTTSSLSDDYEGQLSQPLNPSPPPQWRIQYGGNHPARWSCFEPGGGLLVAPLMSNMKVAFQVGKTVCVHAGLRPDHIQENGGIAGLNSAYRDWILMKNSINNINQEQQQETNSKGGDGYNYVDTIASDSTTTRSPIRYNHQGRYNSIEELYVEVQGRYLYYQRSLPPFLNDPKGPIWMRDYSSPSGLPPKDPLPTQTMLEATLNELDANRMVMGHTIQKQINAVMDGKAWRVDIGMSARCGGGRPEVLEIVGVSESGGERVSVLTEDGEITGSDRFVQTYASMM